MSGKVRAARLSLCFVALLAAAACGSSTPELRVVTSGGLAAAYERLAPAFSEATGIVLHTFQGASMGGAPDSIPERFSRGESFDVVIMSRAGLERLVAEGLVVADTAVDLASSAIGMAVQVGQPVPDISTVDGFKQALLDAESIAVSASVSGTYISTDVFPRLGLAEALTPKTTRIVSERVGRVVGRGDAAVGFQQVSELLPIENIQYVGEIPAELQRITVFTAGITTGARNPEAGAALITYLSSAAAASIIEDSGMRVVTSAP